MVQVSGNAEVLPCRKCAEGFGLWSGCVTNPATVNAPYGVPARCCSNCAYNRKSAGCRWPIGPVPALAGPAQMGHLPGPSVGGPTNPPAPAVPAPAPAGAPSPDPFLSPPPAPRTRTLSDIERELLGCLEHANADEVRRVREVLGRVSEACDRAEGTEGGFYADEEDAEMGGVDDEPGLAQSIEQSPIRDTTLSVTPTNAGPPPRTPSVGVAGSEEDEEGEPEGRPLFGSDMREYRHEEGWRRIRRGVYTPTPMPSFPLRRNRALWRRPAWYRSPQPEGPLPSIERAERGRPRYMRADSSE